MKVQQPGLVTTTDVREPPRLSRCPRWGSKVTGHLPAEAVFLSSVSFLA